MSNDKKAIDRLFKLQTQINTLVMGGSRDAESISDLLQKVLEEKKQYLRHLETVTLRATSREITLAQASDVFTGWVDSDFKNWSTDVPGQDTDEADVAVYEMVHDGTYQTLLSSLGEFDQLCLSQGQIKRFCQDHFEYLRQGGYGTFFPFKVKQKRYVASVHAGGDRLGVYLYRFGRVRVWRAVCRHRVVVQQQIT